MNRYLIVLMGALGDVIRGLHIADAIKAQDPKSFIAWIVEPKCEEIVRLSPSVDKILLFNRNSPLKGFINLTEEIRKNRPFNVCLDLQRHFKSGIFSFISRSKRRIGFHPKNAKELNSIFQTEYIEFTDNSENKFYHYQRFLDKINIARPKQNYTLLNITAKNPAINFKQYCFATLGSSWESKNWTFEGYQKTIQKLLLKEIPVVLIGGADQMQTALRLADSFKDGILNLVGQTSLSELCAVIKSAKFGFGPDSGPGHIASAFGVPYTALFGPTSPARVSPIGSQLLVISANVECSPCYLRKCPGKGGICMKNIDVDKVLENLLRSSQSQG